uniref:Uncharacterized protein n=1 Tax=Oryza rufipogon TaxID=4529 RepID=A0A0E0PZJ6_ORYRU
MAIASSSFSLAAILLIIIMYCCPTGLVEAARKGPAAAGGGDDSAMRERYEKWAADHGRTYKDSLEKARRFEVFRTNALFIDSFNAAGGKKSPRLTTNKFADLTNEEFAEYYGRPFSTPVIGGSGFMYGNVRPSDVPANINWRDRGAVTQVKNQKDCASCWAFSAVAAVEGIHQIRSHNLVALSTQQLLDCSTGRNNHGCNRGDMDEAFRYITSNGGIAAESDYPYEDRALGTCRASGKPVAASIRGFQYVPPNNETALLLAVAHQPVSVALDGVGKVSQFFSSGVFGAMQNETCTTDLNHAMTAVGYGTDEHGTKYWLMKNSWGTDWGEGGYMKIARDVASNTGLCGLAMQPSYPVA